MKKNFWALLALLFSFGPALVGQTLTQTIRLNPGWNAVVLQVAPTDTAVGDVFSNPAIVAVWRPIVRVSTAAFIQNPNAAAFNNAGWAVYVPSSNPASVNNNLFNVAANRPYLVEVSGSSPITVTVTGTPSLRAVPFAPGSLTLLGFGIDPSAPPTFANFFAFSAAQTTSQGLEPIYRLNNASSQWQQVSPGDLMSPGAAYWVFSSGASSYMGPLAVVPAIGDSLDFSTNSIEEDLRVTNLSSALMSVVISNLAGVATPLTINNSATNIASPQWLPLPPSYAINLPAGASTTVRIGIQRSAMTGPTYGTVLAISDGQGSLFNVAVTAELPANVPAARAAGKGRQAPQPNAPASSNTFALQAGLWVGDVIVSNVAQAAVSPSVPTPTQGGFDLRLLLHVTPTGQVRLLREVIEMLQSAVLVTNNGVVTVSQPAQLVLVTDSTLLPQLTGVTLQDNTPVGKRFSTAAFDFDPPGGSNFVAMSGSFGIGNSASCVIALSPTTPSNPFLHRYHPDHGTSSAFSVTRQIHMTFTATDPGGQSYPDYGTTDIGGIYNETITGLHKNALAVSGAFHLHQIVNVPALNFNQ
jgi:hypothetical protein